MSIYPKNISNGENLIIHLRFSNKGRKIQKVRYVLSVSNPNDKQIFLKEDNVILGVGKDEFIKQLYYSLYINNRFIPGKYIVKFYMICNEHIIDSETKDNDYFYVENFKYYNLNGNTIINNNSDEKTNFKLYKGTNIEKFTINGKQKLRLKGKYNYIEYANNKIDLIKDKNKS